MKVTLCVGNYAKTPYEIACLQTPVYSIEEFCFCARENAFLLDNSLMSEKFVDWIDRECNLKDLARELYPMVRKNGSLSGFVTIIMEYTGLYEDAVVREVEQTLREGSGLIGLEKRKNQVDYILRKGKYMAAARGYDELLDLWHNQEENGGTSLKASILHNKGVAYACMLDYATAAACFELASELSENPKHRMSYLSAKRMELSEERYLAFVTADAKDYEASLILEKHMEVLGREFEESDRKHRLSMLKEWRSSDRQHFLDEAENITQALKEAYREKISG